MKTDTQLPPAGQPSEQQAVRLVGSGGWFDSLPLNAGDTVVVHAVSLLLLAVAWQTANLLDETWAYRMTGAAAMLWPMQWAFWLGQRNPNAGRSNDKSDSR